MSEYYVYILECADHTLYTGIAKDLAQRIRAHEAGKGAKYTRGRGPYVIRYVEKLKDRSTASKREREIKSLTRKQKMQLITQTEVQNVSSKEL